MLHCNDDSIFIRSEQCPRCASLGRDKSGDNLAIYSDGHAYCFSCGFYDKGYSSRILHSTRNQKEFNLSGTTRVYEDATRSTKIPGVSGPAAGTALRWLQGYGVTSKEIEAYGVQIAEDSLTFSFKRPDGSILRQQRWFLPNGKRKFKTVGSPKPLRLTSGKIESTTVIIVEDAVSAILLGRQYQSYPMMGSNIDDKALRSLCERFYRVGVWMDADKREQAVKIMTRGLQWNDNCFLIFSSLDPKDYSDKEIEEFVEGKK